MLFRYLIVFVFIGFLHKVSAEKLFFAHVSVDDGLTANSIKSTYVDSYGYVWVGTLEGINRFDGREVKDFSAYFTQGHKSVTCFGEDENKVLWIGTENGLYYWDRVSSEFSHLSITSQSQSNITGIQYDKGGVLYVGTDVGLYSVDIHTQKVSPVLFHKDAHHLLNCITDLVIVEDQVYLATKGGFVQYDISLNRVLLHQDTRFSQGYTCVAKVKDHVYLGSDSGMDEYHLSLRQFSSVNELGQSKILTLTSKDEKLFVGSDADGLFIFDPETKDLQVLEQEANNDASLSSNTITSMDVDDQGILWVGTYVGGLNYTSLSERIFDTYHTKNDVLINKAIRSVYLDENNYKFIGTRNGLFISTPKDEMLFYEPDNDILNSKIILKFFKYKGDVLIGTYQGGICSFSMKTKQLRSWNDALFHKQSVYALEEDTLGNLWVGGLDGIRCYTNQGALYSFNRINSVFNDELAFDIKVDRYNRIWVGGNNGVHVYVYRNQELVLISQLNLDRQVRVVNLYLDSQDNMWIGTVKNGVFVYDMDLNCQNVVSIKKGLCHNAIASIIEAGTHEYWISTLKGLSLYNQQKDSCINFYTTPGLPGTMYCRGAAVKDRKGNIWLGNEDGLVIVDPKKVKTRKVYDQLLMTEIMVGGKVLNEELPGIIDQPVEDVSSLILPGNYNSVGFRFVNIGNKLERIQNYAVKLEGQDEDWVPIKKKKIVVYHALKSGHYTFNVAMCQESGEVMGVVYRIPLIIKHQWHESIFALVLVILVLLMLAVNFGYVLMRYRNELSHLKEDKENALKKYESSHLTTEESQALLKRIQVYLEDSKIFMRSDLRIGDISKALDVSVHDISQSINQNLHQGFTDFINTYRIEAYKNCLQDKEYERFTLFSIAEKCGFNSKSSFNRAFKKVTGLTPSEYATSRKI